MKLAIVVLAALRWATIACAGPAFVRRQSYDETWDDPFISEPINFRIRKAGEACDFQLVYERFSVDSRYSIDYYAEYPDGSQIKIDGISGTLARDNLYLVDGLGERAFQTVFFKDICRFGTAPHSFRANAQLSPPEGYTYENYWTTGSFPLTGGDLPGTPKNVRLQVAEKSSTVTWDSIEGASGYIVIVEWFTDSEVGPLPFVWARELGPQASSFTYNRKFTRASVLAKGDNKAWTALDDVYDVKP